MGQNEKETRTVVSIKEYRRLLGDQTSADERIVERLQYLTEFFRNIINLEIKKYAKTKYRALKASGKATARRKASDNRN